MSARTATESLLMWASIGGGPAVLADVLRLLRENDKDKRARIGRVLYLRQSEQIPLPDRSLLGGAELFRGERADLARAREERKGLAGGLEDGLGP
jgi:hypothetical protein